MKKLKINDEVVVLSGKDSGRTGKIVKLFWNKDRVVVEGINKVKKAMKPTQENPTGGFAEVERSLHLSNIAVLSPKTKKATKVRIEVRNGKNARIAADCGTVLA
jgi:large subunit ribosomal protein L24